MILGYMWILNCTINPQHKNPKLRCSGGTPTRSTAMAFNPSLMTRSRAMAKAGWRSLCLSIRDGPFLGHLPQRWQGGRGAAWQGQCWIPSIGIKSSSTQMHGFKLVSAIKLIGSDPKLQKKHVTEAMHFLSTLNHSVCSAAKSGVWKKVLWVC